MHLTALRNSLLPIAVGAACFPVRGQAASFLYRMDFSVASLPGIVLRRRPSCA